MLGQDLSAIDIGLICTVIVASILALTECFIIFSYLRHKRFERAREVEHYTDYAHGNLVMRVYKAEFEFQAKRDIPLSKILDGGVLSQYYMWILFEK